MSTPSPFETKVLCFNVWNTDLLQNKEAGKWFDVGDQVRVSYHLKELCFPRLDELSPTSIDSCPVCYNALEAVDTQRTDCNACSIIPSSRQKERINEPMTLVSCAPKEYMYSTGYRMELLPQDCTKPYVCVIFPKTLLYPKITNLKVDSVYTVLAWKKGNLLDIIDILC